MTLPIFVGSHPWFARCEPVCEYAIRKHAKVHHDIIFMQPQNYGYPETGCTGFTNMRYAIPHLTMSEFAIYLDVDMLVLADITELERYACKGAWSCLQDGSNEVIVIDCSLAIPSHDIKTGNKMMLHNRIPWNASIPLSWNCEDPAMVSDDMKLIHFTNLKTQPWFYEKNQSEAAQLWLQYEADARREHAKH
jgi:hypothetical protein